MRNDVPRTTAPRLFTPVVSAGLQVTRKARHKIGARAEVVVTEIARKCRRITRSGAPPICHPELLRSRCVIPNPPRSGRRDRKSCQLPPTPAERRLLPMARTIAVDDLTAQERMELIGRLWDSLDPAAAAPLTPALAAELDRREADADAAPEAGEPWPELRDELRTKLG